MTDSQPPVLGHLGMDDLDSLLATLRVPKVRPAALWAANWWARSLDLEGPSYYQRPYPIALAQAVLFREVLALALDDLLDTSEQVELRVDYNASDLLNDAVEAAGMVCPSPGRIRGHRAKTNAEPYLFPNKVTMFVRADLIRLKPGYALPFEDIDPSPSGEPGGAS